MSASLCMYVDVAVNMCGFCCVCEFVPVCVCVAVRVCARVRRYGYACERVVTGVPVCLCLHATVCMSTIVCLCRCVCVCVCVCVFVRVRAQVLCLSVLGLCSWCGVGVFMLLFGCRCCSCWVL